MAKPAKSIADKKKQLIDEQEYVSEKEKTAAKAKVDEQEKAAQAKANKEADLIGAKDSAKLNQKKETKTEDVITLPKKEEKTYTSAADKARNSSLTKNQTAAEAKQTLSESTAKRAGADEGLQKIEARKTEKAAATAKANKEADLPGFDGHAAQKAFEEQKAAEKIEYLNVKEARDKKYALEQELADLKAQAKEENGKAGTVQIVSSGIKGNMNAFVSAETQNKISALEKEISELNKNINLAERTQNKKYLAQSAAKAEDFEEYSKEPAKEENNQSAVPYKAANQGRETETLKGYMTDEERAVYNYYLNKFGKEKAEEFFESIEEDLSYRQAQAIFEGNEGKVINEYIQGAAAGLENSKEGYQSFLNMLLGEEDVKPQSTYDFLSQMAREDLADSGIKLPEKLGGASLGQIGFDVVNTTANMLPSMFLGTLGGGAVGAAAIGASAAGNAYNEALTAGYDKEQAQNYAALVGASEAALGYLLGGIEATGGKLSKTALAKVLPKIDNALAKTAVSVGGKMASEFTEEYLQEVLSPVLKNIALLEENEIDLLSPEAIYSGFLGALSAGGIAAFGKKAEVPVPFDGKAEPGTEAALVADKITEIENRPISEAEKAAKIEEIIEAVAKTTGKAEVIAEAKKIQNYHAEREAEFSEAKEIGKKLGVTVEFDSNIAGNGVHTSDGRIFINPNTENPALQVFIHELTHDIETSGMYENFSKKILDHIAELGYDISTIRKNVKADYAAEGHNLTETQTDAEIVAKYCEQHLFTDEKAIQRLCNSDPNLFQRIKYWIEDMIAKFRGSPEERFLVEAQRLYEEALATRGEVSGARIEQHSYDYSKPFEQQVDDWKTGKIPPKDTLVVGATPKVFQKVGFNALPMTINLTHVDYAINGTKDADHYYGEIDFKKLPQAIEKPIAVFVSKTHPNTSVVALVDLPINGKNSVVPITVDGFGKQNNIMIDSNAIVSAHGKNGALKQLSDAIADDAKGIFNLLYINKKEAQSLLRQAGPQWSGMSIPRDGFIHSIKENGSPVKPKLNNVTESLQFKRWFGDWQKHPQNASKVVDEDGKPLVVYHGTDANFTVFDRTKGRANMDIQGLFFSPYKEEAADYGEKVGAYYLNIKNPADSTTAYKAFEMFKGQNEAGVKAREYLENLGYDGVINDNDEFIAFYPEQIKSATDNMGTFDSQNPDYRYSTGRGFDEIATDAKTLSMERADKNLDAQTWKGIAESINPEMGIWRMKDFARVLDSAAGGNKVLRQQLFDLYEKPLNEAQGEYARNYSEKAKQISEKFKELGIKAESKESAAVQRIGEGVKEIDNKGNTVPYTLDDLKKDFPDSWENIKAGADYCRKVYDEFLHDLNQMYSEIYPATVEQANEKISGLNTRIESDANKIANIETVVENLETLRAEKQAELSRKRPDTLVYAQIQNQIENIDRKIEKAGNIIGRLNNRKLVKEISRDTLKSQIENGEILKNKQIKPRKDYFRHFQELTNEFAEIADIFSNDQRIPPNLAGKSETTKPRTIWTSLAQQRGKNYYTEDAVGGLLRYTEIAEKLLVYDPLISHFRDVNSAIRAAGTMVENEVKGKGTNAGQFAAWADKITNQIAGKTTSLDRIIADETGALGRATMKAIEALNRRVKSNAILGNFRSALVQIGNLPNAMLYIQNPVDWRNGVVSTFSSAFEGSEEIAEARSQSNFMNRRYMGDSINELTKEIQKNNILDKPKEFAIWMLGAGDKAAAELIWHTAYTKAIRDPKVLTSENGARNYENAIDYADDITRRSIGGRAEGDIPYFENSKIIGLVAPFQIEVANTFNAFAEQFGRKNAAGIIAFEVSVFLLNTVLEGITGDRPLGLDFIDVALDIIKEANGEEEDEEEKDLWDIITYAGGRVAGEVISSMPLGTQIGSFFTGGDEQKAENWFGDSDPTRYGTGNIGMGALADAIDYFISGETPKEFYNLITDGEKNDYSEWAKPVTDTIETFAPIALPWGGKQLSRTIGGIDQIIQGGAYGENEDGRYLKFLQSDEPGDIAKTILFGRYGGSGGQNYINSGFKGTLSAKQTDQMELAEDYGISNEDFYNTVLGLREFDKNEEKKEALLQNENLDAREKSVIDWILFGKQDNFPESTRDYSSEEAFYRSGLETGELRLYEDGYGREEIDKIETALKKGGTKVEDVAQIQKALGCTEAEAFEIYERRNGKWIDDAQKLTSEEKERAGGAASLYGMSTEDYLTTLNYSNFGTVVDGEFSDKMEDVIPKLMEATGWDRKTAEKNYNMVNRFDYSRDDLEDEQKFDLKLSQDWYEVDDKGYFTARNVLKTVEGKKDEYGNTIDGSFKEAAVKEIAKQLNIDEAEATIYYLAANGGLILSADDLTSSHRKDMEAAIEKGWTARSYIDAVNVLKITGSTKKEDILKDLQDAGATYQMAQGYYNLRENKDYDRFVGKVTYKYGMKTEKQETKGDYYLEHFGNGQVTEKDIAKWFAAANGCKKKQEYIDAYMSAGATYQQALDFYQLMQGKNKTFNTWWKENGGE